jgi:hypothetical protein
MTIEQIKPPRRNKSLMKGECYNCGAVFTASLTDCDEHEVKREHFTGFDYVEYTEVEYNIRCQTPECLEYETWIVMKKVNSLYVGNM